MSFEKDYKKIFGELHTSDGFEQEVNMKINERKKSNARKRNAAVVAAGLAVCLTIGGVTHMNWTKQGNSTSNATSSESAHGMNGFVLSVNAQELSKDKGILVTANNEIPGDVFINKDGQKVSYEFSFDFQCKGENVKNVSYQIHNGYFSIKENGSDRIILDAKDYEGDVASKEGRRNVSQFTVDYNAQTSADTKIYVCGVRDDQQILNLFDQGDVQSQQQSYELLLDHTGIVCTATYEDGTTDTKAVKLTSSVMTYLEAGIEAKDIPVMESDELETIDAANENIDANKNMEEKESFWVYEEVVDISDDVLQKYVKKYSEKNYYIDALYNAYQFDCTEGFDAVDKQGGDNSVLVEVMKISPEQFKEIVNDFTLANHLQKTPEGYKASLEDECNDVSWEYNEKDGVLVTTTIMKVKGVG